MGMFALLHREKARRQQTKLTLVPKCLSQHLHPVQGAAGVQPEVGSLPGGVPA
jgi:hypothetical protein